MPATATGPTTATLTWTAAADPSGVDGYRVYRGATLVATQGNPIDAIWQDRPAPSLAPALVHGAEFAGKSSEAKRSDVAEWLASKNLDAAVVYYGRQPKSEDVAKIQAPMLFNYAGMDDRINAGIKDYEAALKANWSPAAIDSVKVSASGLMSDIHGTSDYRANLIKVMAQRAVTAAG